MLYKLVSYKAWDNEILKQETGNCLEYFENKMNKPYKNYYHKLYVKKSGRWNLLKETKQN